MMLISLYINETFHDLILEEKLPKTFSVEKCLYLKFIFTAISVVILKISKMVSPMFLFLNVRVSGKQELPWYLKTQRVTLKTINNTSLQMTFNVYFNQRLKLFIISYSLSYF